MIVKVIIRREVKPGLEDEFFELLKQLRANAIVQSGYISGETLICAENTNKVTVISKWESLEDWNNWKANSERQKIDRSLTQLQLSPTVYEPYVFSKYKLAAKKGFPPPLQEQNL